MILAGKNHIRLLIKQKRKSIHAPKTSFDEFQTQPFEENERLQYHIKHNIKIVKHNIAHIQMNPKAKPCELAEIQELYDALDKEMNKLKELKEEPHDWYDPIFYREYDC
jgi:hypothetical protein